MTACEQTGYVLWWLTVLLVTLVYAEFDVVWKCYLCNF